MSEPTLDVKRLDAALRRRREINDTDVLRLVDGDGDDVDNVIIDRYGSVARVEIWASRWPSFVDEPFLSARLSALGVRAVVAVLRTAAGRSVQKIVCGEVPEAHVVHERGLRFVVRTADERAVGSGVFVDQREGRALVRAHARGRVGVNLFAHAGAYGVAMAVGGAARVDHVDMAKKCAPWAALNLAINGIDPRGHRFIVDDALAFLAKLHKKPGSVDVVVCDPPTQAVRNDGSRFVLRNSLAELAAQACAALSDDGMLVLSCNDRDVSVDAVLAAAAAGAKDAGRSVRALDELPLPNDITSASSPRGRPMRGCVLRLM